MSAWPQYAYLALVVLSLGISLEQHGKPKTGIESAWTSLLGAGIAFWLLYMGGFFKVLA